MFDMYICSDLYKSKSFRKMCLYGTNKKTDSIFRLADLTRHVQLLRSVQVKELPEHVRAYTSPTRRPLQYSASLA